MLSAAVGPGKQGVLATQRDGAHGALDDVGVQLEAAIVQEAD
jgi:hypothetical protein